MNERILLSLTGEMVDNLRDVLKLDSDTTLEQVREAVITGEMYNQPEVKSLLDKAMTDTIISHRRQIVEGTKDKGIAVKNDTNKLTY